MDTEMRVEQEYPSRRKGRGKLTGSTGMKVFMFIILTLSALACMVFLIVTVFLLSGDAYSGSSEDMYRESLQPLSLEDYRYLIMRMERQEEEAMREYCKRRGITVTITDEADNVSFEYVTGDPQGYLYDYFYYISMYQEEEVESDSEQKTVLEDVRHDYAIKIRIDLATMGEQYQQRYQQAQEVFALRYFFPIAALMSLLLALICFIFLMCAAGHRNDREGVVPSVLNGIPLEVFLGFLAFFAVLWLEYFLGNYYSTWMMISAVIVLTLILIVTGTITCMEIAISLKRREFLRRFLVVRVCSLLVRVLRMLCRALCSINLVWKVMAGYLALSAVELLAIVTVRRAGPILLLWCVEKPILFILLLYVALACKRLQRSSEALAKGDLEHKVDTGKLVLDFKQHGENLNSIGQGMARAVEDRLRSERLKTELITNVSHDLKTPLTSIINYADLLGSEKLTPEQVNEYAEVLLRQSKRLKKLLEDLVEASKATTGNLEVHLQPCEISVILSQAVGEYEPRFAEKELELLVKQPEEPITIQADGRHLWRVFDNLLNNIYKYAQEHSRVYIDVEQKEKRVRITFRNMSKYALNISAQELEERFVRGDSSRHMEGNGLGLSIAKSLAELQQGSLELYVDGDLFKVVLEFPVVIS